MTQKPAPGDGIKSLRTSAAFKALNFELYAKPNKVIMGLGVAAIAGSILYIMVMRRQYESGTSDYYPPRYYQEPQIYQQPLSGENEQQPILRKKTKWDS